MMRADPSAEVVHACVAVTLQREDAAVLVRDTQLVIDLMMRLQVRAVILSCLGGGLVSLFLSDEYSGIWLQAPRH